MTQFKTADDAGTSGESFFELGLMYSAGRTVPMDFVSAHKWFSLAAMQGDNRAIRLRLEIAAEMSTAEITSAQRAARAWAKAA